MEDNKVLRFIYTFFLGILLTLFVAVGITTFYTHEKAPEYPSSSYSYDTKPSDKQVAEMEKHDLEMKAYDEGHRPYQRNVSILALVSAVVLLMASIIFDKKLKFLADGVMLGGFLILVYSIIWGFLAQNDKYTFLVITISLGLVMYHGYRRLVRSTAHK